jgi:adenylate cyclase
VTYAAAGFLLIAVVLFVLLLRSRQDRRRYQQRMEGLRRELERLQRAFARFTPSGLVERIIDRGTDLAAEKREVTVLFADIKSFTQLTERLEPAVLLRVLGGYFAAMSEAVTSHHGHIARFIGDGLMALFGALEDNPWQVRDAVEAALAMRTALGKYNEDLAAQGLEPLAIGMGIHHGPVVAGVIGAEGLLQFDVHGDVVNVAARVESLTRTFSTDLLVTDAVKGALNGSFPLREMPPTPVKGKSVPILTFAVDGPG